MRVPVYAKIVKGDYQGKLCGLSGIVKQKPVLSLGMFKGDIPIDETTIEKYEITQSTQSGGWRYVKLYWKDGKKSLVECSSDFIDGLIRNIPMDSNF